MIKFGASGNSNSFYEQGLEKTTQSAKYIKEFGLDLFEYSFGRGVRLSDNSAVQIADSFKKENVEISVHAPYYINFASADIEKAKNSVKYLTDSLAKVLVMGGNRVVFHPGSEGGNSREVAFANTLNNIKYLTEVLPSGDYKLCVETMGKIAQIGTVDEIIDICNLHNNIYPCIDFGHINAREQGILKSKCDYEQVIKKLMDNLPFEKVDKMHIHFSKIKYSLRGEVCHLDFTDEQYGPNFEPMIETLIKFKLNPHILCESAGSQAEDAKKMKDFYELHLQK